MPHPSIPTEKVARELRISSEIDDALKSNIEGLKGDFVTERIERAGERSHTLGDPTLNVEAEFKADLLTENAVFRAGVYFRIGIGDLLSEDERGRNADPISLVGISESDIKAQVRGHA